MKTSPIMTSIRTAPVTPRKSSVLSKPIAIAKKAAPAAGKLAGRAILAGAIVATTFYAAKGCIELVNTVSEQAHAFERNLVNNLINN